MYWRRMSEMMWSSNGMIYRALWESHECPTWDLSIPEVEPYLCDEKTMVLTGVTKLYAFLILAHKSRKWNCSSWRALAPEFCLSRKKSPWWNLFKFQWRIHGSSLHRQKYLEVAIFWRCWLSFDGNISQRFLRNEGPSLQPCGLIHLPKMIPKIIDSAWFSSRWTVSKLLALTPRSFRM